MALKTVIPVWINMCLSIVLYGLKKIYDLTTVSYPVYSQIDICYLPVRQGLFYWHVSGSGLSGAVMNDGLKFVKTMIKKMGLI